MFEQREFKFIITIVFGILFYISTKAVLDFFGIGFDVYGPYLAWFFGIYILFLCLDQDVTHLNF